jgi:hypothetical protein
MMAQPSGSGSLRAVLDEYLGWGDSLKDLTVLAVPNDPFRCDTPAGHRDGAWLASTLEALGVTGQRHLRGIHYVLIGQRKPDGLPYTNTDKDWLWLGMAAKAARWLEYLPFGQIVDQRNEQPFVQEWAEPAALAPFVRVDAQVSIPAAEDLAPRIGLDGFDVAQPYRLVIIGEKSSLRPVLQPVAARYRADLYLPTGEISDTLIHSIADNAMLDGRPLVVFYFADCDPAGWQMPISVARKLQAFRALGYYFEFRMHRVTLTPNQVRVYGLPSTPLKDTERRADKWMDAMGVAQTEIDALASLQPALFDRIARDAIAPYYDDTLDRRIRDVRGEWIERAQASIDAQTDADLEALREQAVARLEEYREQIAELMDSVRVDADMFDLPDVPELPVPEIDEGVQPDPMVDSDWDFNDQCRALIDSKRYSDGVL